MNMSSKQAWYEAQNTDASAVNSAYAFEGRHILLIMNAPPHEWDLVDLHRLEK
jgi:hypothetical protein